MFETKHVENCMVVVRYLVTFSDGFEVVLKPDRQYAENYAWSNKAKSCRPMYVVKDMEVPNEPG